MALQQAVVLPAVEVIIFFTGPRRIVPYNESPVQPVLSLKPLTGHETNFLEFLQVAFGCLLPKLTQYEWGTRDILTFRISEVSFTYARRMLHTLLSQYKEDH